MSRRLVREMTDSTFNIQHSTFNIPSFPLRATANTERQLLQAKQGLDLNGG